MKVPYLGKKVKKDMLLLASDLSGSITDSLAPSSLEARIGKSRWISSLYPIFALLKMLDSPGVSLNPSREYAISGAALKGDRELFLKALLAYQADEGVSDAMRQAYRSTIFSGFIAELRSDLLMVLTQGLIYSYRGMAIGLRCALEDLYRHLYYMDHPQEYFSLACGEGEYMMKLSPKDFRAYLTRASYLRLFSGVSIYFEKKSKPEDGDWFGANESIYSDLSAAVHGASDRWFASLSNAGSLKEIDEKEAVIDSLVERFSRLCAVFLISAHRDMFSASGDYDKSIVLEVFSHSQKHAFRRLLNL